MPDKRFVLYKISLCLCISIIGQAYVFGQKKSDTTIRGLVQTYKTETRGPYRDIRWFCIDGTNLPPQERCSEPGGVQRARYRDEVIALGKSNHIFLGQILSTTETSSFWDAQYDHSRMKQYQLEQYLRNVDQGWINRKAQFYRGAFQVEDEEAWGLKFLTWALEDKSRLDKKFFIIRQAAKDIPHNKETNLSQNIRGLSKEISDTYPDFMKVRVKIHGQPDIGDIQIVKDYLKDHSDGITEDNKERFSKLISEMELYYQPVSMEDFKILAKRFPNESDGSKLLIKFTNDYQNTITPAERTKLIAQNALEIRRMIVSVPRADARLALIDASNKMEEILMKQAPSWTPVNLKALQNKTSMLIMASTGFGYLELWEWDELQNQINLGDDFDLGDLSKTVESSRRAVEWGTGMVRANYDEVTRMYSGFEPLAASFIDDRVRNSVLLPLGSTVSKLGNFFTGQAGFQNELMGINNPTEGRGLNAGYAFGQLVVSVESPESIEVEGDKIYVFDRPPADLKPVAGIATVSEGNLVSHVQLLARNLAIPNAVLSKGNLTDLLQYSGQEVFYAVSPSGRVIIKPASEMSLEERALFEKKSRSEEKIAVPIETILLDEPSVLRLSDVNASFSGKQCGPKAANMGELKALFPDNVVNGLVLPFSIFKVHFDQGIPGMEVSYWEFLNSVFMEASEMRTNGQAENEIDVYVLAELDILRKKIKEMTLMPAFKAELRTKFVEILGQEMGKVPVFIRSDTNMEDLKDFTGAGLNLTVFNVLSSEKIFESIKDVWASPYTERSYKWRQKYLENPENVFPSILIIPTVNAECSGVLITKGVSSGKLDEITVAFSRGVGGAVEGQASETWALGEDGSSTLLSPSREEQLTLVPKSGGTNKEYTSFSERILTDGRLEELRVLTRALKEKLPQAGINGPYDVELGFIGDKIWLFQVRPFVENKKASASEYLQSISQGFDSSKKIDLEKKLNEY